MKSKRKKIKGTTKTKPTPSQPPGSIGGRGGGKQQVTYISGPQGTQTILEPHRGRGVEHPAKGYIRQLEAGAQPQFETGQAGMGFPTMAGPGVIPPEVTQAQPGFWERLKAAPGQLWESVKLIAQGRFTEAAGQVAPAGTEMVSPERAGLQDIMVGAGAGAATATMHSYTAALRGAMLGDKLSRVDSKTSRALQKLEADKYKTQFPIKGFTRYQELKGYVPKLPGGGGANVKSVSLLSRLATATFGNHPYLSAAVAGIGATLIAGESLTLSLGLWGYAETGEGVDILLPKLKERVELMERANGKDSQQYMEAKNLYDDAAAYILERTSRSKDSWLDWAIKWGPAGFIFGSTGKEKSRLDNTKFHLRLDEFREDHIDPETGELIKGLSDTEAYAKIKETDAEQFTEDRLTTEAAIIELKRLAQIESDKVRKARLQEEIALWAEHNRKMEIAEREYQLWLSEMWLEYLKKKLKMQEELGGRSHLVFGLLR